MKKVIIRGVYAVGMSHYGSGGSLAIGEQHELRRDADNRHDKNAVAVLYNGKKVASLKRDAARFFAKVMDLHLASCFQGQIRN